MSKNFHKNFRLNEVSFSSSKEIIEFASSISISAQNFLTDWFTEDEFIVVQTSGSTGKPKPIQLKKEFMKNSALATGEFFNLPEKTTALLCLSIDYIAGKMMLVRAFTLGWDLDVVEPVSNPLSSVEKQYDFCAMVPMQLQNSLYDLDKVKKLIVGGGVVSNDLINKIQDVKTEIFATYGMTETITHIAVKKLNNFDFAPVFYQTLPDVTIYKDQRNCLLIKAPKVADELIITNDVVELISDTEFEWLGRFDNVINSGGIKLHPEKIEEKLSKIINSRFFVAGVSDAVLGEKLILVIEGVETKINFSTIDDLTKYEIPKAIYFVDEFVETETKKIQRFFTLDLLNL
ncbi:O-succinylbenzoic acid--CoA ligase [Tenacibaculum adriaticum]|uniref:O-succinylbenzoic acid--CoA ligase n=1 Tax=Tenacibaculum adriaticum TaxID=413713 RepID=A0A5S5DQA4_9FLAO|nr:AMP-binding protein [Tenacibaculum adriaticum]TYP98113.1 O-succinylbenzoic acid--CoA ligase [Tenacibaculum adriaticum]